MKILVTGISSALGTIIARKLSENHEVIGLSKRKVKGFKTISFDLGSTKELRIGSVDVCVHLAFITSPEICEKDTMAYRVNVLGTKKLLEYCRKTKVKKFVFISTGGVYGFSNKPLTESMKPRPFDAYSSMKYKAEKTAKNYSKYFDVVVLRYFFPYGPGTKKDSLINRLINNINEGKKITLHNGGKPVINPIFIGDLAQATALFCINDFKGFNIFNIAGPEKASIREISLMISSITGKKQVFKKSNKACRDMVASISKLSRYRKPKTKLKEGLKITIDYLR
mgnify:CR=1 FL=1